MVQPEKRLLWHPRRENKFLIGGGSQITLYEWAPDQSGIRQITSQHDLQHLKCFAWSPDPHFDDLIAVGNSSGKIELLRLEASKISQRGNVLSNGQGIPLIVRNSRSCNSLAFSSADPNYLASGFDKVRGDCSLIIWDVNTASSLLSVPLCQSTNHDIVKRQPRPQPVIPQADVGRAADSRVLQQHAPTETVSIVSFLPQSTYQLLAGISHRWLRLFDLRSPVPATTNVASKVQGIATDTFDPHRIACFGEGIITVWDSRRIQTPVLTFTEKDASADGALLRQNSVFAGLEFSCTRRGMLASLERDASYVRFWDVLDTHGHNSEGGLLDGNKIKDSVRGGKKSWANLPWQSTSTGHSQVPPSPKDQDSQSSAVLFGTRRTKTFPRPLASFALTPSTTQHPVVTNVMVVNKEGDLELYATHDAPKHATWSSRGDLAITAGLSCRLLENVQEYEGIDEALQSSTLFGQANSAPGSRSRERSILTGGQQPKSGPVIPPPPSHNKHAPLFGRGDEEGFPALGSTLLSAHSASEDNMGGAPKKGPRDPHDQSAGRATAGPPSRNRSASRGRRSAGPKGVNVTLEHDISMVMLNRASKGYGLFEMQKNRDVVRQCDPSHHGTHMLVDLWDWLNHSIQYLSVPQSIIHGFDFSYQGVLGIWEGFKAIPASENPELAPLNPYFDVPSYQDQQRVPGTADNLYGNFQAALSELVARRTGDRPWKPPVTTSKGLQRQIALQLVGWSFREDELATVLQRWERGGELSRAACWYVFTKQHSKAIALLMKSSDESLCMLSGTIAALGPHGSKSTELREHCERLIVRLQDPYLRAMLTHLALNDWAEVLEEEALPFRERLAIAFQFLDDKAVTSYLRRCVDRALSRCDIDGIIIPGLSSKSGLDILQGYVDRTGDIQTAAILGSYVCPPRNFASVKISEVERRVGRWVESYRDLLDGSKMFNLRVGFDIERGQIASSERGVVAGRSVVGDWVPKQMLIRCNYCNKPVMPDGPGGGIGAEIGGVPQPGRPTACPHCNRSLPRCSICLMMIGIIQDTTRELELLHSHSRDAVEDAIVMCQTCRHGGHVTHIVDWFYGQNGGPAHDVCAVADCDCRCAEEI